MALYYYNGGMKTIITNDVTVVGNPTIDGSIVSNFSESNYLRLPTIFNPGSNNWEIVIKATTPSSFTKRSWLTGGGNPSGKDYDFVSIGLESDGRPIIYITSNGTSWNVANAVLSSNYLSTNTTYLFKCAFTGTQYVYSTSQDDGITWIDQVVVNSTAIIFVPATPQAIGTTMYTANAPQFWSGTIDLSQSYIKINDELWWKGSTSETKPDYKKIKDTTEHGVYFCPGKTNCLTNVPHNVDLEIAPLNVTVVGSPTINNGVVSGFSSSNYLILTHTFNPGNNTWKKCFKVKTPSNVYLNTVIDGCSTSKDYQHTGIGISKTAHWAVYLSSNGTSWNIASSHNGSYIIQPNTVYWVVLEYTGTSYQLSYSLDGENFTQDINISNSLPIYNNQNVPDMLGNAATVFNASGWQPCNTIYLDESYITINDELWWKGGTGAVTLKAGSKVYFGDGSSRIIEEDISSTINDNTSRWICVDKDSDTLSQYQASSSGTAPVNTTGNEAVFNTSNNKVELYTNGEYIKELSFPVGYNNSNQSVTPFQWNGSIGCTAFVLPHVKGLISNGYNEDKTYKNIELETDSVLTCTSQGNYTASLVLNASSLDRPSVEDVSYDRATNKVTYQGNPMSRVQLGSAVFENGKITSMSLVDPRTTNELVPINHINRGTELVYQFIPYAPEEVIVFENGEYTYESQLSAGIWDIAIGGAGNSGATWIAGSYGFGSSGGSGAYVHVRFRTVKRQKIKIFAPAYRGGEAYLELDDVRMITAGGGTAGTVGNAGSKGVFSISDQLQIMETIKAVDGNNGNTGFSGQYTASVSEFNSWGQGGESNNGLYGGMRLAFVGR